MASGTMETDTPLLSQEVSHKRSKLIVDVLSSLKEIVDSKDVDSIDGVLNELEEEHGNCSNNLQRAIEDVVRETAIIITGTVSAGKSSLINKIVGRKILQERHQHSTDKICRIQNSNSFKLIITDKNGGKRPWSFESMDDLAQHSSCYSASNSENPDNVISREIAKSAEKSEIIDIFLPLNCLKGDVFLVDTPGYEAPSATDLSGIHERINAMNDILRQYLPNAVGCICVLNAALPHCVNESVHNFFNELLQNIVEMPCFDKRDVIFVINKFETVGDNETWETIKKDVSCIWPWVVLEKGEMPNLFKFSIRESERDNEYKREYERFKKTLDLIVEKYHNRRIRVHSRYAKRVIETVKRSVQSRLMVCENRHKESTNDLKKLHRECEVLQRECQKTKEDLEVNLMENVEKFSDKLRWYVKSPDFKRKVVHFEEFEYKMMFAQIRIPKIIISRFNSEIQSWMEKEADTLGQTIDNNIEREYENVRRKIRNIEKELTGVEQLLKAMVFVGNVAFGIGVFAISSTIFATFIATIVASMVVGCAFILWHSVFSGINTVIEMVFSFLVKHCTEKAIKQSLDKTIALYQERIRELFVVELPAKLRSIQMTIETLESKKELILTKMLEIKELYQILEEIEAKLAQLELN